MCTWIMHNLNFSSLSHIIEVLQEYHLLMYDLKSPKFIYSFCCSFIITCVIVALLAITFNYLFLWSPLNPKNGGVIIQEGSIRTKQLVPKNKNTSDVIQLTNQSDLAKPSVKRPNIIVPNALARSSANNDFEKEDGEKIPVAIPPNGLRLNFLPETHELRILDDDIGSENILEQYHPRKSVQVTPENDQEATRALHMALQMKKIGKNEKAVKLFQHALALNSLHPDVLNHYGEFLEDHTKDIIKANHFYTRALVVAPLHSKALQNRERTMPVVDDLDEKQLSRIDQKRDYLIQIPENDSALKRVKKEAYFQHIHHTVAIEGNTMTLAETRMIVETRMAVPGKSIMEHNEIIGLEAALKYINSTLVSKVGRFLVSDILQIHKRVLGHVDPLEAGSFRTSQVYVGEHTPPPASDLQSLMEEFVEWMNSPDTFEMHPVKFAALAHFKLVQIHPFVDGNGRTGRLLMNLILMRAGYPPVIVRKQDRSLYYEFLQMGNDGDVRPFIRFIAECTERTLDVYLYATEYGNVAGLRALASHDTDLEHQVKIIEV